RASATRRAGRTAERASKEWWRRVQSTSTRSSRSSRARDERGEGEGPHPSVRGPQGRRGHPALLRPAGALQREGEGGRGYRGEEARPHARAGGGDGEG